MHLKNQPPALIPEPFIPEIEKMSKAMLMDMVWDLATRCSGADEFNGPGIMEEIRDTAHIVRSHRDQDMKDRKRAAAIPALAPQRRGSNP